MMPPHKDDSAVEVLSILRLPIVLRIVTFIVDATLRLSHCFNNGFRASVFFCLLHGTVLLVQQCFFICRPTMDVVVLCVSESNEVTH